MTIENFYEEMRLFDFKPGDAIYISYWGNGMKFVHGDFVRIDSWIYPQRIEWMEQGRLRSLCHRNIRRIGTYDWTHKTE